MYIGNLHQHNNKLLGAVLTVVLYYNNLLFDKFEVFETVMWLVITNANRSLFLSDVRLNERIGLILGICVVQTRKRPLKMIEEQSKNEAFEQKMC